MPSTSVSLRVYSEVISEKPVRRENALGVSMMNGTNGILVFAVVSASALMFFDLSTILWMLLGSLQSLCPDQPYAGVACLIPSVIIPRSSQPVAVDFVSINASVRKEVVVPTDRPPDSMLSAWRSQMFLLLLFL